MLKKTIIALSIIPQYLLIKFLGQFPEFIETYYSNGVYPYISKMLRYVLGWIPFSFGDLLIAFAIIYILRWFFLNRKRVLKDTKHWFVDVFCALSIIYFVFHLFWGMNYYRLPLYKSLSLKPEYSTEQLVSVTEKLIVKTNAMHFKIKGDDTLKVEIPYSKSAILKMAADGYDGLKEEFPHLEYHPKSVKKSLLSYPLTYMGVKGFFNPLTNEAQVDGLIPVFRFPTTASHEIAHQLGFAAENEANFIGCLAAINNDDVYFEYTGYAFALQYCLNEIYRRDKALYKEMVENVNKSTLANYKEARTFWEGYQSLARPVSSKIYNSYLKANQQDKGKESYSYVVALFVNYFETADFSVKATK